MSRKILQKLTFFLQCAIIKAGGALVNVKEMIDKEIENIRVQMTIKRISITEISKAIDMSRATVTNVLSKRSSNVETIYKIQKYVNEKED